MSSFVITGATGYIGSQTLEYVLEEGNSATAIIRKDGDASRLENLAKTYDFSIVEYDGTTESVVETISNANYVIHLAALYDTRSTSESVSKLITSNIVYTSQILQILGEHNKEAGFVTTSTFSSFNENGDYSPATVYAATKTAVEALAPAFAVKAAFLRLGDTYGPGDWRTKVHNLASRALDSGETFEFRSPKDQKINLTHVNDVIRGLLYSARLVKNSTVPLTEYFDFYYPENELSLSKLKILLLKEGESGLILPEDGKITQLPPQVKVLPDFSLEHNPQQDIFNTIRSN